jgi:cell division transport system permease protein
VVREVTIQIRPAADRDLDAEVGRAVETARTTPGVAEVRALSHAESARLLEPWLGTGLSFDDLPVPRLIVLRLASDATADLDRLRASLAERVAGASLDDHRAWTDHMRAMSRTVVGVGLGVLVLVFAATMLSVAFATRGAMATNRAIIEVLHLVGARDGFIAAEFQRHFLILGLGGGVIGGGTAILAFAAVRLIGDWFRGAPEQEQIASLFGALALGPDGYGAVVGQVVLIAAVTAVTSRITVRHTLRAIE